MLWFLMTLDRSVDERFIAFSSSVMVRKAGKFWRVAVASTISQLLDLLIECPFSLIVATRDVFFPVASLDTARRWITGVERGVVSLELARVKNCSSGLAPQPFKYFAWVQLGHFVASNR